MSSIMGVLLGHVHDGMMVNLRADNIKLRERAAGMVARIASVGRDTALSYLNDTGGAVKPAILLASGARDAREAHDMLTQTKGHLRAALAQLNHRREGADT